MREEAGEGEEGGGGMDGKRAPDDEEDGDEGPRDVRHKPGGDGDQRVVERTHVRVGRGVRPVDPLLKYVRQLVELPKFPQRQGGPLTGAHVRLVRVEMLRVLEEKLHGHEEQHERQEEEVDDADDAETCLVTTRGGGMQSD